MSLIYTVIYAAHANGSHHKLALDALRELRCPDAEAWQRLFLKHAGHYLKGSKLPDTEFKDFKNHVLHVGDGCWGGALEAARSWYERLIADLGAERWADAVTSAGVLSHYVVDPFHPFHTAQSEAENNIHRAVEWSIAKSYDSLRRLDRDQGDAVDWAAIDGEDWLARIVAAGAERAHAHYATLIAHYDFSKGVADPPSGLDDVARQATAGLIADASSAFGVVLGRAIVESGARPPDVDLRLATVLAALAVPAKWVLNRIADSTERRAVAAMLVELQETGKVEATLTDDVRAVRDEHLREIALPAQERLMVERLERMRTRLSTPSKGPKGPAPFVSEAPAARGTSRPRIADGDPVERAPSIGPKTAERLGRVGIETVGDFLAASPEGLASRLATRHIDAVTIADWQAEARLAVTLPGLSGTNAALLVAGGCRSVEDLSLANGQELAARLAGLAGTPRGLRIVRDGKGPSVEDIARWIEAARVIAAKAA